MLEWGGEETKGRPTMMRIRFALVLCVSLAPISPVAAQSTSGAAKSELQIALVVPKDEAGKPYIPHADELTLLLTNRSDKPIRIWDPWCNAVADAVSFRVIDSNGNSRPLHEPVPRSEEEREYADLFDISLIRAGTLAPGSNFTWRVYFGRPLPVVPNAEEPVTVTAILQIKPDANTKQHGVWTGRVESAPVKGRIIDPKLRMPVDYLQAGYPGKALAMIQADAERWQKSRSNEVRHLLNEAVRLGHGDVADWLLQNGADVNTANHESVTPLQSADNAAMVKLLIKHKANLEAKDSNGQTRLQRAAEYAYDRQSRALPGGQEQRKIVHALLDGGAFYDVHSAIYLGDDDRALTLLKKDPQQSRSKRLMYDAVRHGRPEIVKWLLDEKADPHDADGGYPLIYYALPHPSVVKRLLDAGEDPNMRLRFDLKGGGGSTGPGWPEGMTLLHQAAQQGYVDSAKVLIARGAKLNADCANGRTPLEWAIAGDVFDPLRTPRPEMVKFLLTHKIVADTLGKRGQVLMQHAAERISPRPSFKLVERENARHQAIIEILHAHGVPIDFFTAIALGKTARAKELLKADPALSNSQHSDGTPMLHHAVTRSRLDIVELLLNAGADVNGIDKYGATALHAAAMMDHDQIASLLIARKADVEAARPAGWTPLHNAAHYGATEVAKLLLAAGANADAKDEKGMTPLNLADASRFPAPELVELLRHHNKKR
jgi:ankyrin repeat protein